MFPLSLGLDKEKVPASCRAPAGWMRRFRPPVSISMTLRPLLFRAAPCCPGVLPVLASMTAARWPGATIKSGFPAGVAVLPRSLKAFWFCFAIVILGGRVPQLADAPAGRESGGRLLCREETFLTVPCCSSPVLGFTVTGGVDCGDVGDPCPSSPAGGGRVH